MFKDFGVPTKNIIISNKNVEQKSFVIVPAPVVWKPIPETFLPQ